MKVGTLAALAAILCVFLPGAAASDDGVLTLRGFGTATIDGDLAPGEWDGAGKYDFQANRAPAEGGGTVPATLYVMNDGANLYLGLRVSVTSIGGSVFETHFSRVKGEQYPILEEGDEVLRMYATEFQDLHVHFVPPYYYPSVADQDAGGTIDGTGATGTHSGFQVFEVSHPLNSADDSHDFSVTLPRRMRFFASFQHCLGTCAFTSMPESGFGEVFAVTGTHVPPNTTITRGPRDGAQVREEKIFEFAGTDDIAVPPELTFECKVDAEDWSSCESPIAGVVDDGWHTLGVRAVDDMLNMDPTPATRRWRIDTKAPSRPRVSRAFRFSSTDRGTPRSRIRFRCALDTKRLHACGSVYRRHIPAGRHVLRVRAVDPAGNESGTTTVRIAGR